VSVLLHIILLTIKTGVISDIKESKTSVPGTPGGQHAIEYGAYKSLDKLLNWPDDWKK
jgi:hypothetical protein